MTDTQKISTLLQLAVKAGKAAIGRSACEQMRKKGKIYLFILAKDSSSRLLEYGSSIPAFHYSTCAELGKLFGREKVGIIGISDRQFSEAISKHMPPDNKITN